MLSERRLYDRKNYAVGSYLEDRPKYKYIVVLRQVYEKNREISYSLCQAVERDWWAGKGRAV